MLKLPRLLLLSLLLATAPAACGGDDDDDGDGGAADAGPDGSVGTDWQELIAGGWQLPAGTENWYCTSKTLDEDIYIGAFRPIDPVGTHHTLLTYGAPSGPDRDSEPCAPEETSPFAVYASGVNTNALEMPEGVGFKIEAGQQIHLNLHVFNTGESMLTGTSGVEIRTIPADQVEHEAEMFLPGPYGFEIPQNEEYTYSSNCNIVEEQHVFALFPHMHQLGRHFKAELTVGGESRILYDDEYQFEQQAFVSFAPVKLSPGDRLTTTCTWFYPPDPERPEVIRWGNSSTEEMCYSITMRYPRLNLTAGDGSECTDEVVF